MGISAFLNRKKEALTTGSCAVSSVSPSNPTACSCRQLLSLQHVAAISSRHGPDRGRLARRAKASADPSFPPLFSFSSSSLFFFHP